MRRNEDTDDRKAKSVSKERKIVCFCETPEMYASPTPPTTICAREPQTPGEAHHTLYSELEKNAI